MLNGPPSVNVGNNCRDSGSKSPCIWVSDTGIYSRYENKKLFLSWMKISSESEVLIQITSLKKEGDSVMRSFTPRTRRRHCMYFCLMGGFHAATMPQKGASSV